MRKYLTVQYLSSSKSVSVCLLLVLCHQSATQRNETKRRMKRAVTASREHVKKGTVLAAA